MNIPKDFIREINANRILCMKIDSDSPFHFKV
jgi:hypothetical protein